QRRPKFCRNWLDCCVGAHNCLLDKASPAPRKVKPERRRAHLDTATIPLSPSEGERAGERGSFQVMVVVLGCTQRRRFPVAPKGRPDNSPGQSERPVMLG